MHPGPSALLHPEPQSIQQRSQAGGDVPGCSEGVSGDSGGHRGPECR